MTKQVLDRSALLFMCQDYNIEAVTRFLVDYNQWRWDGMSEAFVSVTFGPSLH